MKEGQDVCVCVDAVQISGFCQIDSPRRCDDCGADSDSDNTLHHRSTATLHAALVRAQTGDKAIKDLHTLSFVIH